MAIITEGTLESLLESYASAKVEFCMGSFRPMENSEFLEALANECCESVGVLTLTFT